MFDHGIEKILTRILARRYGMASYSKLVPAMAASPSLLLSSKTPNLSPQYPFHVLQGLASEDVDEGNDDDGAKSVLTMPLSRIVWVGYMNLSAHSTLNPKPSERGCDDLIQRA